MPDEALAQLVRLQIEKEVYATMDVKIDTAVAKDRQALRDEVSSVRGTIKKVGGGLAALIGVVGLTNLTDFLGLPAKIDASVASFVHAYVAKHQPGNGFAAEMERQYVRGIVAYVQSQRILKTAMKPDGSTADEEEALADKLSGTEARFILTHILRGTTDIDLFRDVLATLTLASEAARRDAGARLIDLLTTPDDRNEERPKHRWVFETVEYAQEALRFLEKTRYDGGVDRMRALLRKTYLDARARPELLDYLVAVNDQESLPVIAQAVQQQANPKYRAAGIKALATLRPEGPEFAEAMGILRRAPVGPESVELKLDIVQRLCRANAQDELFQTKDIAERKRLAKELVAHMLDKGVRWTAILSQDEKSKRAWSPDGEERGHLIVVFRPKSNPRVIRTRVGMAGLCSDLFPSGLRAGLAKASDEGGVARVLRSVTTYVLANMVVLPVYFPAVVLSPGQVIETTSGRSFGPGSQIAVASGDRIQEDGVSLSMRAPVVFVGTVEPGRPGVLVWEQIKDYRILQQVEFRWAYVKAGNIAFAQ